MQVHRESLVLDADRSADWWSRAECAHYAKEVDFFPSRGESARHAKAVCERCPVTAECLEYSLRFEPLCGVWGGLTERERRQLRRQRDLMRRTYGD